jgi:hypothetical protein
MLHRSGSPAITDKILIGWCEYVELPTWGIRGLHAKVDTGARTSAIHVENVQELPAGRVGFDVILGRRKRRCVRVEAPISRRGRVRSSSGHAAPRIFVTTTLRVGPVERTVELSLIGRDEMTFRMLLGRAVLSGQFVVDVSRRDVLGKPRRRQPRP